MRNFIELNVSVKTGFKKFIEAQIFEELVNKTINSKWSRLRDGNPPTVRVNGRRRLKLQIMTMHGLVNVMTSENETCRKVLKILRDSKIIK